ncbi:AlpA family phage regulatory protein [Escherichia coli]|uniref:helix-turn-helix transcriptional regulator n=1 Tax=Escherichia coli TaxID=562 RepID=UPI00025CAD4C|nr:AlpA family phage regulatory protein [Escherichia coli]EFA6546067.1 AlpA family phage regulatory protein [Escherichia coli O157:H7]MED6438403.1 AlpA family phage regulatory protein [Escherichia coli O157]EEQ1735421.1 AlpA family phage regulatory protein [Escherichia coli]EEQ1745202.1 AlpA family phage regulatory protein [Escherichia coli]EEU9301476.1 AlpA family phage regulatory protein [Escherichia coli]
MLKPSYIRPKNLAEELGISMPSLWRWVKAGKMPKPVKLSPRVAAFSTAEINSWLEAKSAD